MLNKNILKIQNNGQIKSFFSIFIFLKYFLNIFLLFFSNHLIKFIFFLKLCVIYSIKTVGYK